MTVLSDVDRNTALREFVHKAYAELAQRANFDVALLRQAINETDAWIDSNATSYNNALNATFRTSASAQEKTLMFCYVALKRAGVI